MNGIKDVLIYLRKNLGLNASEYECSKLWSSRNPFRRSIKPFIAGGPALRGQRQRDKERPKEISQKTTAMGELDSSGAILEWRPQWDVEQLK